MASENEPILPPSVLRNIGDKMYEKRKQAALEVEQIVKHQSSIGHPERVSSIIDKLVEDTKSTQPNHRKGGLLCLAAIAVGLGPDDNDRFLDVIVPPVLDSFRDPDSGVRYYGLEALYNIAKVSRESFLRYFSDTFDSLFRLCADSENRVQMQLIARSQHGVSCMQNAAMILDNMIKDIVAASNNFDIDSFIPRLARFLAVPHMPNKRRFLIDWTSLLQSVPDIDMLSYLPNLLDGMMNMLSDNHTEIRTAAARTLDNFLRQIAKSPEVTDFAALTKTLVNKAKSADDITRYTAIRWLNCFLLAPSSHDSMLAFLADLIVAVLPCISHSATNVRDAAIACNHRLLTMDLSKHLAAVGIGPVLTSLSYELVSQQEPTRLEALKWVQVLLEHNKAEVLQQWHDIMPALLDALTATSDGVVNQALLVHVKIAQEERHFKDVLRALLERFQGESGQALLQKRGTLIIRGLCSMLGGTRVFRELATILEAETNCAFAASITQALNLMLLSAPELASLRAHLQRSQRDPASAHLLRTLYSCWCHSACAALSLCMLAEAYQHVGAMIHTLADLPLVPVLLAQVDRFVMLIDSPVFTRVRLQLLSPERYPDLMRAMYSLLMLCPQSRAFHTLHARLSSVPTLALLKLNDSTYNHNASGNTAAITSPLDGTSPVASSPHEFDVPPSPESSGDVHLPWAEMLHVFKSKQEKLITYHEDRDRPPRMGAGGQSASGVLPASIPVNAAAWETASSSSFAGTPGTKRLQSQNALSSSSPGP